MIGLNQQNIFHIQSQNQKAHELSYNPNQSSFDIPFDELNSSNNKMIQDGHHPYFSPNLQQPPHQIQPVFNNLGLQLNNVNLQQTHIYRKGKRVQINLQPDIKNNY